MKYVSETQFVCFYVYGNLKAPKKVKVVGLMKLVKSEFQCYNI
jgi:hypothetical protein